MNAGRGPLVGRSAVLGDLVGLLDEAAAGRGGAAVVSGEAGIGKTRLLEELATHAGALGITVAWGRCTELEGVPPFWAWRQVLGQLPSDDGTRTSDDRPASRGQVLEALVATVGEVAERQPVLVLLEDAHWADADSRWLLRGAVDATAGRRLAVVCTLRTGEGASDLDSLPPRVSRVVLDVLAPAEAAELALAVAGGGLPEPATLRAAAESGGNPLFIRELVRMRVSGGGAGRVPQGVRDVLTRRLARLPSPTVAALTAVAVLGSVATVELVAAMESCPAAEVLGRLGPAVDAALVEAPRGGPVAFVHAVVREVLLDQAGTAGLARLHERAALALEQERPEPPDEALALHWAQVPGPDAADRAVRHGRRARERARRSHALDQARSFAELVWRRSNEPEDRLALGDARARAGDLPGARADLLAVAEAGRTRDRPDLVGRAALAMAAGEGGFEVPLDDVEQVDLLEEAARQLPPGPLRARVRARLAVATSMHAALGDRLALASEAVGEAEASGDDGALLQALSAYADMIGGPRTLAERVAVADRMLALAVRSGDRDGELLARRFRLVALLEQGDFTAADVEIAAFERLSRSTQEPAHRWYPLLWHGMRALLTDRVADAEAYADAAEAAGARAHSANAAVLANTLRLAARYGGPRVAELLPAVQAYGESVAPDQPQFEAALAGILAVAGDADGCGQHYRPLAARGFDTMVEDAEYLSALLGLAESALLLQDRTGAAVLRDLLLPHADLWIVDGIGAACWGLVGEWLARIEDLLGHPDEAARLRAGAAERYRSAGAVGPLRRLSETGRGGSAAQQVGELCREPGGWVVSWNGQSTVLPDLKGLRDLQLLVTRPGTALSSLALLAGSAGLPEPVSTGSDEVLDDRARAAYRRRLRELEDEMAEAAAVGDAVRAERAQEERDLLVRELAAALGLGGRSRRLGDETDRARKAVTMRVRDVIGRLDGPLPDLARHLRDSVRTGRECVYAPDTAVAWRTSSSERVTES